MSGVGIFSGLLSGGLLSVHHTLWLSGSVYRAKSCASVFLELACWEHAGTTHLSVQTLAV